MTRILSIGEAMLELSPADDSADWRLGVAGDTLNTAWYLRRLLPQDWQVDYMTRVGMGEFSRRMVDFLTGAGIGTAHVGRDPDREIGLYAISLKDGERSFSYWRDNSAARRLADDPAFMADALAGCDLAYFSGITLAILSPVGREALLAALAAARAKGTRIVLDTNLRPRLWSDPQTMCDTIHAASRHADLMLPSYDDEAAHFGDTDPQTTLDRYLSHGAGHVVVKNGGGKIWYQGADGCGKIDDLQTEIPVDTTAAGDSFNAGYLSAALQGKDCDTAIRAGHALSRQVIRHKGALVPAALDAAASA